MRYGFFLAISISGELQTTNNIEFHLSQVDSMINIDVSKKVQPLLFHPPSSLSGLSFCAPDTACVTVGFHLSQF